MAMYLYIMDKYQQNARAWNGLARIYEEKFMHLPLYNDSYDAFAALVHNPAASILETGSGPGNIPWYLLPKHPGWQWLGTDVAPAMIEMAQKNNPSALFKLMDARDIGSINQSFDGIISGFCLPFLSKDDCTKFFNDCKRLLHSNGVLYLSFMDGPYEDSTYKTGSNGTSVYFYYHPLAAIEQQLKQAGFAIEKLMRVQYSRGESQTEEHTIVIAV